MKKLAYILPLIILVLVMGESCQKQTEFDKVAMLEGIVKNSTLPAYETLHQQSILLETAGQAYVTTPTLANLQTVQGVWKTLMTEWSKVEMLNFGPGREIFRYLRMDNTPANVSSVDNAILGTDFIDSVYIAGRSSYTKGIACVEYLLFGENGQQAVVDWYATDVQKDRRAAYLIGCLKNIKKIAFELHDSWGTNGGYGATLSQTTDNSTTGGLGQYTNAITHICQTMARKKLGKALGKEAADNLLHPEFLESPYAAYSWGIIAGNLKGIQEVFGDKDNGLGSYLSFVINNDELTNKIANRIQTTADLIDARTLNLVDDLSANTAEVEAIYQELAILYDELTEMVNYFSVTLLPNPDDGD